MHPRLSALTSFLRASNLRRGKSNIALQTSATHMLDNDQCATDDAAFESFYEGVGRVGERVVLRNAGFNYLHGGRNECAVQDLNLTLEPGSTTLLCGASGCGKSTVLRMVTGLVPHFYAGEYYGYVKIGETDVATTPLVNAGRIIANVAQNPRRQFFTTDVDSELVFAPANYGWGLERIQQTVGTACELMGINSLRASLLSHLSGGQLQRVACGVALGQDTPVVVLDEPTSNLDEAAISQLRRTLDLLRKLGKTVLIAEHRVHYLNGLIDTAVYLQDGRAKATYTGEEFFALSYKKRKQLGLRSLECVALQRLPAAQFDQPQRSKKSFSRQQPSNLATPATKGGLLLKGLIVKISRRKNITYPQMFFPAGAVTAVTGPNGVGKTTLANALCGFKKICKKRGDTEAVRVLVGVDGQCRSLHNSDCFLVMQDVGHQLFASRVDNEAPIGVLQSLGLADQAAAHPLSLSGGQQQRLVIATALAQDCKVLIFDEPTSGVDYRHLQSVATKIRELTNEGRVVIILSHDAEFINACADYRIDLAPSGSSRGKKKTCTGLEGNKHE